MESSSKPFQTLNSISAEKNSTVIFPLPIDLITNLLHGEKEKEEKARKWSHNNITLDWQVFPKDLLFKEV